MRYGLYSNAVTGLTAKGCTLVVPRVDDCIALFVGSGATYRMMTVAVPGTFYLNRSWIDLGDALFSEYQGLVTQVGEERAGLLGRPKPIPETPQGR